MARRKRGTFLNKQAPLSFKEKTRLILIRAAAIFCILITLLIGCYVYLLSWLQGEGFRQFLAAKIKERTGAASVVIPNNLSIDGKSITLPSCEIEGMQQVSRFSISKLHMDVDRLALLRRMLRLHHFSVEEMQLNFRLKDAATEPTAPAKATISASSNKLFIKDFKAKFFESHYTDTAVISGNKKYSLDGYHLVAEPRPAIGKDAWAVVIENGRIRTPYAWLKESGVKSAHLLYRSNAVQLSDCIVDMAPGRISAQGAYQTPTGLWNARVDVQQANVSRLLNSDWRKRLTGELYGHMDFSGNAAEGKWEAHGELRLEKGLLEGLPVLSDLRLQNTTPYRSLPLERATCRITYPYSEPEHGLHNVWLWDNIDIRAKDGLLLLRGRITTGADGALAGAISIGLPSKTLAELGLSKTPLITKLFNAPVELPGYVWLRVNLSGTVSQPQEDLSVRLSTVLQESLPTMADHALNSLHSVINSFIPGAQAKQPEATQQDKPQPHQDENPASKAKERARSLLNTGLDLLL